MIKGATYPYQFASHVIEWYLWNVVKVCEDTVLYGTGDRRIPPDEIRFDPEDWSRYDGELQ